MTIKEIKKMIKKIHAMIIIIIITKMNEITRDQNYHMILINIAKGTINEDITLRIVYY